MSFMCFAVKNRRKMILSLVLYFSLASAMSACKGEQPHYQPATNPLPSVVGADRDAHGCIGSAGYTWCAQQSACVRPWELAREKGFELVDEAFERFCSGKAGNSQKRKRSALQQ
jgi:hypothetical protein